MQTPAHAPSGQSFGAGRHQSLRFPLSLTLHSRPTDSPFLSREKLVVLHGSSHPKMSNARPNAPRVTKTRTGVSLVRNAQPSSSKSSSRPTSTNRPGLGAVDAGAAANDLTAAFGSGGGKVYIKGQAPDEDELAWGGVKRQGQTHSRSSPAGSGANTPALVHVAREDSTSGQGRQRASCGAASTHRIGANTLRSDLTRLAAEAEAKARQKAAAAAASEATVQAAANDAASSKPKKPSSREVRRLEKMVEDLSATEASAEKEEGCFCQGGSPPPCKDSEAAKAASRTDESDLAAPLPCVLDLAARLHPLSTYTPSCSHCGLVLCHLQSPHQPCPSCGHALLTPLGRQRVIDRLRREIVAVEAREEHERLVREQEEQLRAIEASGGGAFPTLPGAPSAATMSSSSQKAQERSRKVITLGAAGGGGNNNSGKRPPAPKVVTYTSADPRSTLMRAPPTSAGGPGSETAPPAQTRAERKARPTRVARPVDLDDPAAEAERQALRKRLEALRAESGRRWAGLTGQDGQEVRYVEPSDEDDAAEDDAAVADTALKPAVPGAEVKEGQQAKKKRSRGKKKKTDEGDVAVEGGQDAARDSEKTGNTQGS